jgi:hypothetical protein
MWHFQGPLCNVLLHMLKILNQWIGVKK